MRRVSFLMMLIAVGGFGHAVSAQVFSDKVVGEKNTAYADSLKKSEYPYALPIWGQKAAALGFDLPYSAGLGINYIWQKSDLIIDNLKVGFNNGPQYNLDEIVRFTSATSEISAVNFRPDIWILPFLNVYAVFVKGRPNTRVGYGIYVPDSANNATEIISLNSVASFDATAAGFGLTPTVGVGGGWLALDMNFTWTDVEALDEPAFAFVFGPRMGKQFKLKKPEQSITFWVGAFRLMINTGTNGSLPLDEVFPIDELQGKVDQGFLRVDEVSQGVETWWNELSSAEQASPANKAKYATANRTLEAAGNFLNAVDAALSTAENSSVQYSLDKRPKDMWNFVLGTQYQINKHFMLRAEYGFLGSRKQFIGMFQYRFGL